jgi:hypothetical protein
VKERERERERERDVGFVLAILGFCVGLRWRRADLVFFFVGLRWRSADLGFCGIALEKSRFSVFLWGCVGEEQI